jgi:hypothetical protein
VIKVEWKGNPDTRFGAMAPVGGRAAREAATGPLEGVRDGDMGGQFNNKNPGKRGLSLNLRDPEGLKIAKQLVALSDVVAEGFSPGVLGRLGFGYDVMKAIRPDIIYAKQSGMGGNGTYGAFRTVGPVAAAFGASRRCRDFPSRLCRRVGAIPFSTGWAPMVSAWRSSARSITGIGRGKANGLTHRSASRASSRLPLLFSITRPMVIPGIGMATVRRGSPPLPTAPTAVWVRTVGSRSPASMTCNGMRSLALRSTPNGFQTRDLRL